MADDPVFVLLARAALKRDPQATGKGLDGGPGSRYRPKITMKPVDEVKKVFTLINLRLQRQKNNRKRIGRRAKFPENSSKARQRRRANIGTLPVTGKEKRPVALELRQIECAPISLLQDKRVEELRVGEQGSSRQLDDPATRTLHQSVGPINKDC